MRGAIRSAVLMLAGILSVGLGSMSAAAQSIDELKQRVQELERSTREQVEALRRMIEAQEAEHARERPLSGDRNRDLGVLKEQVAQQPQETSADAAIKEEPVRVLAGIEGGRPFIRSADDAFRLQVGGRLNIDYGAAERGARLLTGPGLHDRFDVRRARLELSGRFFQWLHFKLDSEFTEGVSLKDGFLDFRVLPAIGLRVGQFKVPFGFDQLTSSNFIDFVERSLVDELAPARDIGAMVHGSLFRGAAEYMLGAFNGAGEDTADGNSEKMIAGRVIVAPFRRTDSVLLKGLQLGANVTWGDEDRGSSARGRTNARTSNRFQFFSAQPTQGDRTRWGVDLAWLVGPASLKFEYDEQINERRRLGAAGADLDEVTARGWFVSATYVLTGEDKVLNGPVVPRRPFAPFPEKMGPGAWEVGLRYAELSFESGSPMDFFDGNIGNGITGGGITGENAARALTAGVNWYVNSRTRAMFNWTRYWYDNPLGTPFSCRQTMCGAGNLQPGDDTSWEILSRLQLWF